MHNLVESKVCSKFAVNREAKVYIVYLWLYCP